jgi:prepilin-type N-terminal cleavage/methylation domain-containing protein/prepilin-type processing-associated H-X9-DG protein
MTSRQPWDRGTSAYTLTEVLVVCAIIGILASMLMPSVTRTIQNGRRARCAGGLRQVAIIMSAYAHDHFNHYPQSVPRADGGAQEDNAIVPVSHGIMALHPGAFHVMADDFKTPQVLVCPVTKFWLPRVRDLGMTNISYALNLHAQHGESSVPLLSDSTLSTTWKELKEFPRHGTNIEFRFTFERHQGLGNVAYGDSHVESRKKFQAERPARAPASLRPRH